MSCAVDRIEAVCPPFSTWVGAIITDPVAGTETTDVEELDMGTVAAASNSDAKALTLEFPADFDDSVFATRGFTIWLANNPGLTGHTWAAEFEAGATFPAVSLDAVLAGTTAAAIANNPWDAARHVGTSGEYDGTGNRIANILLQLQLAAGSTVRNQSNEIATCPVMVLEFPRMDEAVTQLRAGDFPLDEEKGHLFAYSEMRVYEISGAVGVQGSAERWQLLGSIKDDTVEMTEDRELIDWRRGKPESTVHQAVSNATASCTFQFDQAFPDFEARALQTTAAEVTERDTIEYSVDSESCSSGVIERGYCIEWRTIGGFIKRKFYPRGILRMTGSTMPGGTEFAAQTFEITALAAGVKRILSKTVCTKTPIEQAFMPITYNATA